MAADQPVTIDTQHEDMIHDAQFDYYAKKVATCSSDRTIQIYDVTGDVYNKSAVLTGHDGPVWQVAWAHPKFGVLLASCSYDGQVIIHRESPQSCWTQIHVHRFHESSVNSLAWAPHEFGLVLACASADGRVSILTHQTDDRWTTAHFQDSPLGCNAISWAPYNAIGSQNERGAVEMRVVTGSCDNKVRFWRSTERGWEEEAKQADVHSDWVRDVAWAPSSGMPCNLVASGSEDGQVHIWQQTETSGAPTSGGGAASSPASGQAVWQPHLVHNFGAPVWRVSWSVTGNVLAVSSGDHMVTLWKQSLDGTWFQVSSVKEEAQAAGGTASVVTPTPAS
uniref:Anaphase-promoting complex subunit 4-like WD40 domain-containing protein n=1 Tax=Fibrocapsa japonica TaxID=94617 RepID=A0A7S2UZ04_9STRA|mmetsp:Transcript_21171/g.30694  ORF Transcript_21171/g.30694 Transcript_21171/m.30694 type:complete len:336 (+) Transcript_21171:63-1070(+)|eukprot:CAMPEP_0113943058 /NCGR_PEP_ID=MMETSP1339-20121228/18679_1 /TAXON_ID=94617 /ORGANISM="Fibrocapsa japonica" /LENGTH=335 /DNA_ID=CAMNT_0000947811 /DNA_START=58 /DNA_END=1065 /DNA_ORIENTATION=+ /assembly_acc=CAM_ASM_000762